ncbi:hypothetical protein NC651_019091 [Populus alba x Populus x berolinensis]|nr:hypothetical protein NC651_019091 [Populus alba x Populus x berolinensis]
MRGTLLANRRGIQRFRQLATTAVKSSKIKLLLFCCIAFTLVVVATGHPILWDGPITAILLTSSFLQECVRKINLVTRIDKKVSWFGLNGRLEYAWNCLIDIFNTPKGYAIVMNTWKRYDLLKQSISHYASCSGLESIHIVWSEPNPPSDSLSTFLNHVIESKTRGLKKVELSFDINKEDSLNNRFKENTRIEDRCCFFN